MKRVRFSPRSSFARTLLLIVTLLFVSLVTTYLVVLNFAILPLSLIHISEPTRP